MATGDDRNIPIKSECKSNDAMEMEINTNRSEEDATDEISLDFVPCFPLKLKNSSQGANASGTDVPPFDKNFNINQIFKPSDGLNLKPYKISDPINARVLIFNIQHYYKNSIFFKNNIDEREGSQKDVYSVCQAFQKLGNNPEKIEIRGPAVKTEELKATIKQFASDEKNKDLDVFITVILAHGDVDKGKDMIKTSEMGIVELRRDVILPFTGKEAPLAGIPKLFFIQACRGKERDKGLIAMSAGGSRNDGESWTRVPIETDIFIAQPAAPNHVSFRLIDHGSYFMQNLANRLFNDGADQNLELNSIMIRVASDVSKAEVTLKNNPNQTFKQALWWTSSLRKPFYFKQLSH